MLMMRGALMAFYGSHHWQSILHVSLHDARVRLPICASEDIAATLWDAFLFYLLSNKVLKPNLGISLFGACMHRQPHRLLCVLTFLVSVTDMSVF